MSADHTAADRELWNRGYQAALQRGIEMRGDLGRILIAQRPFGLCRDEWENGFQCGLVDLAAVLLPFDAGAPFEYTHVPDEADAQAVHALAEGARCSVVRRGLFGDESGA